jgi:cobalt-zinc-cadmium efflux system membrane fusion protein
MTSTPFRLALLGLAAIVASCSAPAPEDVESETVVPVVTARADTGTITASIRATGTVVPAPGAELIVTAPEPGRIAAMPKAEGDTVRRGDLLVEFDIPSARADLARQRAEITRAEARLENARAAQRRAGDLYERGVAAHKEVEDADRAVADAEADLAGARAASAAAATVASRSVVRATFDGIVARRAHNPGDLVEASASDVVMRIVDPRRLEVSASVPAAEAMRVRIGAPARIVGAPEQATAPVLKVAAHPGVVQAGTATVPVRLALVGHASYPVGTPVEVDIDAESRGPVVIAPAAAIVHDGEDQAVFVAVDGKAQRRAVTTGLAGGDRVEIVSGVQAGDLVIVRGQNGLPDGARISVAADAGQRSDSAPERERAGAAPGASAK